MGLSVVTEAWQVEVEGVSLRVEKRGSNHQSQERGRWPWGKVQRPLTSQRKKTNTLAGVRAQEEGVAPKGQRDSLEAEWTWEKKQLGRRVALLKTAVT